MTLIPCNHYYNQSKPQGSETPHDGGAELGSRQDWRCLERRCFSFHNSWAVSCRDV